MKTLSSRSAALFGVATLSLLAACSTTRPPMEEMAVGRASVERASGPAAAEAPVELAAARGKLERANAAMASKNYDEARRLAAEADAEAALAEAKARSTRSERALAEVRESIRQLREQATQAAASRG